MKNIAPVRFPVFCVVAATSMACSDLSEPPKPVHSPPSSFRASVAGFSCELTYNVITETNDAELATYEVAVMTDTARVCQTWTGNDYNVEVTQIGSSEPATDYAEDIKTVVYQNGVTTAYDVYNNFAESQPDIGPVSFDFVAATASEKQASYEDPYYGGSRELRSSLRSAAVRNL